MAQTVLNQYGHTLGFEAITFIPAGEPPHRQGQNDMAPARHRLKMVQLATADNPAFQVSDVELRRSGPSYTADTLETLCNNGQWPMPAPLLIGSDALAGLSTWHRATDLIDMALFLQVERPETPFVETLDIGGKTHALHTHRVDMPPLAISASWVRLLLQRHAGHSQALRYAIPGAVITYIANNGLYRQFS